MAIVAQTGAVIAMESSSMETAKRFVTELGLATTFAKTFAAKNVHHVVRSVTINAVIQNARSSVERYAYPVLRAVRDNVSIQSAHGSVMKSVIESPAENHVKRNLNAAILVLAFAEKNAQEAAEKKIAKIISRRPLTYCLVLKTTPTLDLFN